MVNIVLICYVSSKIIDRELENYLPLQQSIMAYKTVLLEFVELKWLIDHSIKC